MPSHSHSDSSEESDKAKLDVAVSDEASGGEGDSINITTTNVTVNLGESDIDSSSDDDGETLESKGDKLENEKEENLEEGEKGNDQSPLKDLHSFRSGSQEDSTSLMQKMIKLQRQVEEQKKVDGKEGDDKADMEADSEEIKSQEGDSKEESESVESSENNKEPEEIKFKTLNRMEDVEESMRNVNQQEEAVEKLKDAIAKGDYSLPPLTKSFLGAGNQGDQGGNQGGNRGDQGGNQGGSQAGNQGNQGDIGTAIRQDENKVEEFPIVDVSQIHSIDTNQQEERPQNLGAGPSGGNSLQKELETHLTKSLLQARNTSNIGFLNQRDENEVEAKRNNSEDKVLLKMAANLLQSSESKAGTDHLTGQVIEKYKVWNLDWQLVNVNFNVNSANL